MRDIWEEEGVRKQAEKEIIQGKRVKVVPKAVKKEYRDYLTVREKSLAEMRKHLLDYLEREKYAAEIFDFIEKSLGEAGFSKI